VDTFVWLFMLTPVFVCLGSLLLDVFDSGERFHPYSSDNSAPTVTQVDELSALVSECQELSRKCGASVSPEWWSMYMESSIDKSTKIEQISQRNHNLRKRLLAFDTRITDKELLSKAKRDLLMLLASERQSSQFQEVLQRTLAVIDILEEMVK
jgi:hypothetical protein